MAPRLEIHLLGRPVVRAGGVDVPPPRGAKAWGLLAYLVATDRAHPRAALAELLCAEAADPLGALRWNLAALRRLLGRPDALKSDLVRFDVADAVVDLRRVQAGDVTALDAGGGPLLADLAFPDCPVFELWLAGERARVLRQSASLLREGVLRALADGALDVGVRRARQLVALEPLDEGHHALCIRALAVAGDAPAARSQYEQCRAVLRSELAVEPGPAVIAAAHFASGSAGPPPVDDPAAVDARMAVAWQSFLAGSVEHGVDLGRDVVAAADRGSDAFLPIMARLFLAAKLSIAVRGWDEAAMLATDALRSAEQGGDAYAEATARGVLAGIDLMRADYRAAARHATVGAARSDDPGAQALNLTFLAAIDAEVGRGAEAVVRARGAVDLAEASADPVRIGYATAYAGQALLLEGEPAAARAHLERCVAVLAPMLVLLPWPLALLSEAETRVGNLDAAAGLATRAGAIAATSDVSYQRGLARRAEALVLDARGEHEAAIDRLTAGLAQARRTTGEGYSFHWPIAWILESLAEVSGRFDPAAGRRWAEALLLHARTVDMWTFVERGERLLGADR